jgi:hypothetical protein
MLIHRLHQYSNKAQSIEIEINLSGIPLQKKPKAKQFLCLLLMEPRG